MKVEVKREVKMEITRIVNYLKTVFWTALTILAVTAVVVEYFLMDAAGGLMADSQQVEFIFHTLMVLLSLGACYLSLRLFKMGSIEAILRQQPLTEYKKWSLARIALLFFPAWINIVGYLLFLSPSYVYLAIILLLTFAFIYPTKGRYMSETGIDENDEGQDADAPIPSAEQ